MVFSSCGVPGCYENYRSARRNNVQFYTFPKAFKGLNMERRRITEKRRVAWLNALKRNDITIDQLTTLQVCSKHFVFGKPSQIEDEGNIDWTPTINLNREPCDNFVPYTDSAFDKKLKQKSIEDIEIDEKIDCFIKEEEFDVTEVSVSEILFNENIKQVSTAFPLPQKNTETCYSSSTGNNLKESINNKITNLLRSSSTKPTQSKGNLQVFDYETTKGTQTDPSPCATDFELELRERRTEVSALKQALAKFTFCREAFVGDEKKLKFYTGFSHLSVLDSLFLKISNEVSSVTCRRLENFQKLILTIMKLRSNVTFAELSYRFGIKNQQVSRVFKEIVLVLSRALTDSIQWPDRERITEGMPPIFRKKFENRVMVMIHCLRIRLDKMESIEAKDTSVSKASSKFLIAITEQGLVSYVSTGYDERISDKFLIEHCGLLKKLFPGDYLLSIRGLQVLEVVNDDRTRPVETQLQIGEAVQLHAEYLLDTILKKFKILNGPVSKSSFFENFPDGTLLDHIMRAACAFLNMTAVPVTLIS